MKSARRRIFNYELVMVNAHASQIYSTILEKVVSPFCVEEDICLHSFGWSSSQIFKTSTTSVCVYGYVYGNCCLTRKNPEQSKKINVSVRQTD